MTEKETKSMSQEGSIQNEALHDHVALSWARIRDRRAPGGRLNRGGILHANACTLVAGTQGSGKSVAMMEAVQATLTSMFACGQSVERLRRACLRELAVQDEGVEPMSSFGRAASGTTGRPQSSMRVLVVCKGARSKRLVLQQLVEWGEGRETHDPRPLDVRLLAPLQEEGLGFGDGSSSCAMSESNQKESEGLSRLLEELAMNETPPSSQSNTQSARRRPQGQNAEGVMADGVMADGVMADGVMFESRGQRSRAKSAISFETLAAAIVAIRPHVVIVHPLELLDCIPPSCQRDEQSGRLREPPRNRVHQRTSGRLRFPAGEPPSPYSGTMGSQVGDVCPMMLSKSVARLQQLAAEFHTRVVTVLPELPGRLGSLVELHAGSVIRTIDDEKGGVRHGGN